MRPVVIIIFLSVILFSSCFKEYSPKVEDTETLLVVEGLITNRAEAYKIRLSRAANFVNSNDFGVTLLKSAEVAVTDNFSNKYAFKETSDGVYTSDPSEFVGVPGRTYTLHIITSDKEQYESTPQLMPPAPTIDSIYGNSITKEYFLTDASGGFMSQNYKAIEMYTDIKNISDSTVGYRIVSHLVQEYMIGSFRENLYVWTTFFPNQLINLTTDKEKNINKEIKRHTICVFPDQIFSVGKNVTSDKTEFFEFAPANYLTILAIRQYSLNDDSYNYCKEINKQISAEGKIFDPIINQLKGNISSIDHSEKLVLGFFEASSVCEGSYKLIVHSRLNDYVGYKTNPIPFDLEWGSISTRYPPPSWWIYK